MSGAWRATPDDDSIEADDCPVCGHADTLVAPVCSDEHEAGDCPDRLCIDCGTALFIDPPVRTFGSRRRARPARATHARSA